MSVTFLCASWHKAERDQPLLVQEKEWNLGGKKIKILSSFMTKAPCKTNRIYTLEWFKLIIKIERFSPKCVILSSEHTLKWSSLYFDALEPKMTSTYFEFIQTKRCALFLTHLTWVLKKPNRMKSGETWCCGGEAGAPEILLHIQAASSSLGCAITHARASISSISPQTGVGACASHLK